MKFISRFAILVLAVPLLAQAPPPEAIAPPLPAQIAGGFATTDCCNPEVRSALDFIHKHHDLLGIRRVKHVRKAWVQSAAGTNVKLLCRVRLPGPKVHAAWEIQLWHKLDKTWAVTSSRAAEPLLQKEP